MPRTLFDLLLHSHSVDLKHEICSRKTTGPGCSILTTSFVNVSLTVTMNNSALHVNLRKEPKRLTVQPITEYTLLVRMEAGLSIICTLSASRTGSIGPYSAMFSIRTSSVCSYLWVEPFCVNYFKNIFVVVTLFQIFFSVHNFYTISVSYNVNHAISFLFLPLLSICIPTYLISPFFSHDICYFCVHYLTPTYSLIVTCLTDMERKRLVHRKTD